MSVTKIEGRSVRVNEIAPAEWKVQATVPSLSAGSMVTVVPGRMSAPPM